MKPFAESTHAVILALNPEKEQLLKIRIAGIQAHGHNVHKDTVVRKGVDCLQYSAHLPTDAVGTGDEYILEWRRGVRGRLHEGSKPRTVVAMPVRRSAVRENKLIPDFPGGITP